MSNAVDQNNLRVRFHYPTASKNDSLGLLPVLYVLPCATSMRTRALHKLSEKISCELQCKKVARETIRTQLQTCEGRRCDVNLRGVKLVLEVVVVI